MIFFDKIYYINLEEDIDKKIYFENEINKSILSKYCTRFKGVSGKYIDLRLIDNNIISGRARKDIQDQYQRVYGVSLTYGALGCALSHRLIYQECANGIKPFLVFEDDIILHKDFDYKLQEIIDLLINDHYIFDIIYLGYNEIANFSKTRINTVLSKPSGLITGTYGYILSPSGAKKILNTIFPLDCQIDSSISNNLDKLIIYCSTIKLIEANTSFGSKTQQQNSCVNIESCVNKDWNKLFI